ncbi:PHD finger protein 7-like [Malaya genurostris]|uniref:PHD finger protein 7-like n=1 Tax=Malaya genurostris TaxID=325434 RepID=UPI0026F3C98B|nr:PHD finger protein 7-like [Malaya genurostris]
MNISAVPLSQTCDGVPTCSQANETLYEDNLFISSEPRFNLELVNRNTEDRCYICLLTVKHPIKYGEFMMKQLSGKILKCHYFCLLSGSLIHQRGSTDTSGVLGFLVSDIYNSLPRFRNNICNYCTKPSAPIQCASNNCDRWFHYICGYDNNCLTQFTGQYISYCHEHQPIHHKHIHDEKARCFICLDTMTPYNPVSSFYSHCPPTEDDPRTLGNWYHRKCMLKSAATAGYEFKCPACYERKEFKEYAKLHGIYVPQRDAAWEKEKGAFWDTQKKRCTAKDCVVEGKGIKKKTTLVGCNVCGGESLHLECANLKNPNDYVCSVCMDATFIKLF